MVNLIVDVSKYLMILLVAIYTYLNFRYFYCKDGEMQKKMCERQNLCMFLIHLLAYSVLWLKTEDERLITFYGAQFLFFVCYIHGSRLFYRNSSRLLINNMCMLDVYKRQVLAIRVKYGMISVAKDNRRTGYGF